MVTGKSQTNNEGWHLPQEMLLEIERFMDAASVVCLAVTGRLMRMLMLDDRIWRRRTLAYLRVNGDVNYQARNRWLNIYTVVAGSPMHSFSFREQNRYVEHQRIGALVMSGRAYTACSLSNPLLMPGVANVMLDGCAVIEGVREGIWVADAHYARCCHRLDCEELSMILDIWHLETFLDDDFRDGRVGYDMIGSHIVFNVNEETRACPAVLDFNNLHASPGLFDFDTWTDPILNEGNISCYTSSYSAAVRQVLRATVPPHSYYHCELSVARQRDGQVVGIRISQSLRSLFGR